MDYFRSSTIHGVSKAYNSKQKHKRLFWLLILSLFIGSFTYFLCASIRRFFLFDVQVTTTFVDHRGPVLFPSITICNVNRASTIRIREMMDVDGDFACEHNDIVDMFNEADLLRVSKFEHFFIPDSCSFNQVNCFNDSDYVEVRKTIIHGTCYTFNYKGNAKQRKPGPDHGLQFVVDIEEEEYYPCDFQMNHKPVGAYIVIHPPHSPPNFENSIIASPNQLTRIGMMKTSIKRLPHPYIDNCRQEDDTSQDEYPILANSSYTLEECFLTCFIYKMNETCGEIDPESSIQAWKNNVSFKVSDPPSKCILNYTLRYNNGEVRCICRPLCYDVDYHYSLNIGKWPPKHALKKWAEKISEVKGEKVSDEYIRDNLVAVQVYYNEFKSLETIHMPDYNINNFASDIGGFSGLWIGASIFSIIELVAFIVSLVTNKMKPKTYKHKYNANLAPIRI